MRTKRIKRLGVLGATTLITLAVVGPMAGNAFAAPTTTTTGGVTTTTGAGGTTTTTLPTQTTVSGSMTDNNKCSSVLNPALAPPGNPAITVSMTTTAFPQPHEGDTITLSNTKISVSIPAGVLQTGVDAGIIMNGQVIPSVLDLAINGSGTTQKSHHYTVHSNVDIQVGPATPADPNGVALPLKSTLTLPNTTWTPVSKTQSVLFSEKSLVITSTIDLSASIGQIIIATFTCDPSGAAQFMALGGLKAAPTTTTTAAPVTTAPATIAPSTAVAAQATNTLPITGSDTGWLLALAVVCLSAGLFALRATSRRSASRP